MKNIYQLLLGIVAILFGQLVFGQTYDFENVSDGSTGTGFGNGWIGTPATGYRWEANAGPTISSGTGPDVDHTLGTSSGIYVYTEASSPASAGDTAYFESPTVNLTPYTNPGVRFWYHKAGAAMGDLYIDIYSFTTSSWTLGVDSIIGAVQGTTSAPWLEKVINLSAFSGQNIILRFTAVYGSGWSGDMAIDDVSFVDLPSYDAALTDIVPSHRYYMIPEEQNSSINFNGTIENLGVNSLTGVTLNADINGTLFTGTLGALSAGAVDTVSLSSAFSPPGIGFYQATLYVTTNQVDQVSSNDTVVYGFEISDTTLSRENDGITNGIGFNGLTGIFGQMMELFDDDTLTSISIKLTNPPSGSNMRILLYTWTSAGQPGALIDSSDVFTIPADTVPTWYLLEFPCDRIMTAGKYFFAVQQMTTTNLSVGYTSAFYEPNVCYYDAGSGWTTFETAGFQVSLAIRPNFGSPSWPSIDLGPDTAFCQNSSITIDAGSGWSSYTWSDGSTNQTLNLTSGDTVWVTVEDNKGCPTSDTIVVDELPLPQIMMPNLLGICDGVPATLVANNDPTYTYLWNDGSTDSTLVVTQGGTYSVTVTDPNGCQNIGFSLVQLGTAPVAAIAGSDTVYFCTGQSTTVMADSVNGSNAYVWSNGQTGTSTTVNQTGWLTLSVMSPEGCFAYDSVWVDDIPAPTAQLVNDTITYCEGMGGQAAVMQQSGVSYLWSNGATTPGTTINQPGQFWVSLTNAGNCTAADTGWAIELPAPQIDLGNDTTICYLQPLTLDPGSGYASYVWSTGDNSQTIVVDQTGDYSVTVTNDDGCEGSDTISVTVEICEGILALNGSNSLYVFPNPADRVIQLQSDIELEKPVVQLFDAKGALVYQKSTGRMQYLEIPAEQLESGIYILKITTGDKVLSTRIVVSH